jgi:hypothetical protein
VDELYVVARRVLLDALEALGPHLSAVVLVGQAIYLRVGEADLAVAAFTSDGDLGIEPVLLGDTPALQDALAAAKLEAPTGANVGIWTTTVELSDGTAAKVCIDLLVPRALSPKAGRRAAPLRGHHERAARVVAGLEGIVVDFDQMTIAALDIADPRAIAARVAGPGALLVAKLHKIAERSGSGRQKDKDALDVLRLLRGIESEELAARVRRLIADERSCQPTEQALKILAGFFGRRGAEGIEMAIRATGGLAASAEITASCEILTGDLLALLGR